MSERGDGEGGGGGRFREGAGDDLRAAIADAIEQETAAPDAGAAGASPDQVRRGEGASQSSQTPAGAREAPTDPGRAQNREGRAAAADAAGTRDQGEGSPADPRITSGEAAAEDDLRQPPHHWSAADKATFNALPEAARAPFLDMYKRMESGFTPKLQRGAQLERDYGALDQTLFTPQIRGILQQKGIAEPRQMIEAWASVEVGLVNPQTRPEVLARLINAYQADPAQVAEALQRLRGGVAAGGGTALPPIDPALTARLDRLEAAHHSRAMADQQAVLDEARRRLDGFIAAKDAAGRPAHPYYHQVEHEMTRLAAADRAEGLQTLDLEDLYERAIWSNPKIRAELIAADRTGVETKGREERRAQAERARRAAVSVSGAPGPGGAQLNGVDRTLRDEIRAAANRGPVTSGGPGRI